MRKLRLLSLCTGIGAIDYVWSYVLGQEIAGQVEIDPYCTAILAKQWPTVPRYTDIEEVAAHANRDDTIGTVDLVAGGIPCQPFSTAGKRHGTADDRYLWPYAFSIVQRFQPTWVLIENVAGFVHLALDLVQTDLESAGYQVQAYVFPACAIGAPHIRERVFVVAHASGLRRKMCTNHERVHPTPHPSGAVADAGRNRRWQWPHQQGSQPGSHSAPNTGTDGAQRTLATAAPLSDQWVAGTPQSRVGRGLDGAADWVDGTRWPALPGQPQHPWEPARTMTARRDPTRARRLKALGNAIVPQHIYPLLYAIVQLSLHTPEGV